MRQSYWQSTAIHQLWKDSGWWQTWDGRRKLGCRSAVLVMLVSFHRRLPLCTTQINNPGLKFNLAGNLLITLLLAFGKQNELKYFYLTARALANRIVALISLYTQKHKVGFPVLACDQDKPLDMLWLVDMDPKSHLISHAVFWNLFLFRISENEARNLGLNSSPAESCGAVISPLPSFCLVILCPITRKPQPFPKWASQYYHSSVSRLLQGW